jgi:hypothetical protein
MAKVLYRPVVHSDPHTIEQQMFLLATAAHRAWSVWAGGAGKDGFQGMSPELDDAMREIYRQLYQTDVFMGGLDFGRNPTA